MPPTGMTIVTFLGITFSNLNAHVHRLASVFSLTLDTSITTEAVPLVARHGSGLPDEPSSVTIVPAVVNGAPSTISVLFFGHTRRKA